MPVDNKLIDDISLNIGAFASVKQLSFSEAKEVISHISDKFIDDADYIWWWQSLKQKSTVFDYGDDLSWPHLEQQYALDQMVYLVVNDDEPSPWPVYIGEFKEIGALLSELWRFEYFIVDVNYNKIVFDNHHNEFVIATAN